MANIDAAQLEARVRQVGADLVAAARGLEPAAGISDRIMDAAMADPGFKTALFRFVDVFPAMRSADQLQQHLSEYLEQPGINLPPGLRLGLKAGGLLKGAMRWTVSSQIESMAGRFIAGRDEQDALPRLRQRWDQGMGFSVDLLGEACLSEAEAAAYRQRYVRAIDALAQATANWSDRPALRDDPLGPVPRVNVSLKITAMAARADAIDFEGSLGRMVRGIAPVLEAARTRGVFVNFDMEQHALKDLTFALFMRCAEGHDAPMGLAVQAYLRGAERDVARLAEWAAKSGRVATVRLVKGAYWDYEVAEAERRGWPSPVWRHKGETDACYERATRQILEATPRRAGQGGLRLALGSHNARSIAVGLAAAEALGLPAQAVELQMLYGMAEGLKRAAVARGLRVREYTPVGEMLPGMAYLVRRLLENTSNESWLRSGYAHDVAVEKLVAPPQVGAEEHEATPAERHALSPAVAGVGDGLPFFNEPLRDFSVAEQRAGFSRAIAQTRVPKVGNDTTVEAAGAMVRRAEAAWDGWREADPVERANYLVRAAAWYRQRRDELAAVIVQEVGKPWRHADGDVCEAIDFWRLVGELNELWHEPRGVAAVISPWNFPMAIACGMAAAALATGNPVVLKPAEQSPGIAQLLCEGLWQAGVPRDVLQFAPGPGETVGAALVCDPRVALVCFTGSMKVGLEILRVAGGTPSGQTHVKQVVCEMGGKNAIIIDATADLDEAVPAVIESAFGYSGQRCSACSRVIVHEAVREAFTRRLAEATLALLVGDPREPGTDVGPLIDADAGAKVRQYIEIGRQEGQAIVAMQPPEGLEERLGRPVVGPHIFGGIKPGHRLANEEVFGPVLALMDARSIEEAIAFANGTGYRLTGGLFSRTPSSVDLARRRFRVGNLYINRGIVGALVGRQPFGGFGLSGTGSQAGGPDYLARFVVARACSENTLRRGFAPQD
ncbi:MAG: proline dehydrogenase family protein [Planctomycetota bacterium]|nr:proline dehydrogenase family protein [Planctomycetota bacterium]